MRCELRRYLSVSSLNPYVHRWQIKARVVDKSPLQTTKNNSKFFHVDVTDSAVCRILLFRTATAMLAMAFEKLLHFAKRRAFAKRSSFLKAIASIANKLSLFTSTPHMQSRTIFLSIASHAVALWLFAALQGDVIRAKFWSDAAEKWYGALEKGKVRFKQFKSESSSKS